MDIRKTRVAALPPVVVPRDFKKAYNKLMDDIGGKYWRKYLRTKIDKINSDLIRDLLDNVDSNFHYAALGPAELRIALREHGWKEIRVCNRAVYAKDHTVLKVAISGSAVEQNYNEIIAYRETEGTCRRAKFRIDDKLYSARIPRVLGHCNRYTWLTMQRINPANRPSYGGFIGMPTEIRDFFENLGYSDVHTDNIAQQGNTYWLIDLGFYKMDDNI